MPYLEDGDLLTGDLLIDFTVTFPDIIAEENLMPLRSALSTFYPQPPVEPESLFFDDSMILLPFKDVHISPAEEEADDSEDDGDDGLRVDAESDEDVEQGC